MQAELNVTQPQAIKLDIAIVSKDKIYISSSASCTTFCNETRKAQIDLDELLLDYKRVIRLAKAKGIKIVYNKKPMSMRKQIESLRVTYPADMEKYNAIFDELVAAWEVKLPKGIYSGYRDDDELDAASKIAWGLLPLTTSSSNIGQVISIQHRLNEVLRGIQYDNYSKFSL